MERLSVIVPVYNVEPYIERCLRSLQAQDISKDNYEIICINDGSTDNSRELIISLQNEFENIILIDQVNRGVSVARNRGIDIAKGEYLIMVDPDDYLKANVLRERLDILSNWNIDVGYAGYIILAENNKEKYRFDPGTTNNILTGIEFNNIYIRGKGEVPHRSWAIFIKSSFLKAHNIRYLEGVKYLEDAEFMAKVNCLANKVITLAGPIYLNTSRPGSATTSKLFYTDQARFGFLKSARDLLEFRAIACKSDSQRMFLNQPIIHFVIVFLISFKSLKNIVKSWSVIRTLKEGPLKKLQTEGCSRFYHKMGTAYNISVSWLYIVWSIYKVKKSITLRIRKLFCYDDLK